MKRVILIVFSALAIGLMFIGCPEPGPTTYERIVIDTYSPNGSFTADTYIDLFDSNGDPDADDPWTEDDKSDAIAYDDNSNPELSGTFARIDYQGGLTSGTYYIRVRGASEALAEYYAIRVLSLKVGEPLPSYSRPGVHSPDADPYEPDDTPISGGVPDSPVNIGLGNSNQLSRYYEDASGAPGDGDVDWFKLVLP